jgi:hypothetical protein
MVQWSNMGLAGFVGVNLNIRLDYGRIKLLSFLVSHSAKKFLEL